MNGNDSLMVDSNLFILLMSGSEEAERALDDKILFFSFITEIELLGKPGISAAQQTTVKKILGFCNKLTYSDSIGNKAIALKQQKKIKVPDAIIAATALVHDLPLITADNALAAISDLRCIVFKV